MAIRMQQRTGTYDQWNTANPILNSAEIGYESDTNKFKIGDGTNHWNDLPYFLDEVTLGTSLDGYIPDSLLGVANGVAQLNSSGKLVSDQIPNVDEITQDAINTALVAGTGLDKTYDDNANTITLDIDSTVATKTYVDDAVAAVDLSSKQDVVAGVSSTEIGYLDGVTSAIQTQIDAKAPLESPTFTGTVSGVTKTHVGLGNVDNTSDTNKPVSTATQAALDVKAPLESPTFTGTVSGVTKSHVGLGNVDDTSDSNKPVSTATQTALDLKANLAGPTFTGTTTTDDLVVDGDFTVNGTNFAASATSITIEDNMVQLAHENVANTVDLGIVVGYNDGTAKHAGIVRDVSDDKWKLFKGVTTEPATTVDFTQGSLDNLQVAGLEASSATIGDVSNTELQYLNGVTSAVQTQIDAKAPTESPTFTGTVSGVTKAHVGLGNVDNTTDAGKPVSTATQTALDLKANLAGPTFTGTVTIPNGAVLGTPTSATLTNATGLPVSTGISGLGTGVATFLGTPTAANLATMVTDETGSGNLVFATSPTLVTPVLGVATATSINGTTIPTSKTLVATDSTTYVVPSQTGNSGKYLTTDGTTSSWGTIATTSQATPTTLGTVHGETSTTLTDPVSLGYNALVANTSGTNNTAVGAAALDANTTGAHNTALGANALGANISSSSNTAVGRNALTLNTSVSGSNTAVGDLAGSGVTSGAQNTLIGGNAATALATGSNNTVVGYNAAASSTSVSNEVTIGNASITKFRVPGIGLDLTSAGPADATLTNAATGIGYTGLPQNATTTGAYTIVVGDAGKHIYSTATRTVTIPANASVAFPVGTVLSFISGVGATTTIAITTDTMYLAGAGTTGSRTLAAHGMATAVKITSTSWIISGNGLS